MTLATVDADGMPNARMVLLKGFDERGFVFYTNLGSVQGPRTRGRAEGGADVLLEIAAAPGARCAATSSRYPAQEADAYFATRSRMAQIGAWASQQSAPLESRLAFEKAVARYTAKFGVGTVPRPPHWSGYRVVPHGDRVLAGAAVPPARPHRVSARRTRPRRGARRGSTLKRHLDRET